jgi:hypothetical protein
MAADGFVCKPMRREPPTPKIMASAGAPDKANPKIDTLQKRSALFLWRVRLASAQNNMAQKHNCANAGEVSCDKRAKPKQAKNANKPPSATARA